MKNDIRSSGIGIVGNIRWGTHFCQFYQIKEDLIEILIPYFKAGLENNEFCLWITSNIIGVKEAEKVLRKYIPNFDNYTQKGQIEIISSAYWYLKEGTFDSQEILDFLTQKLNYALDCGYEGLRLSEDTFCGKDRLDSFVDYEKRLNSITDKFPIIGLCTYSLEECSSLDIIEIATTHNFSLGKRKGKWEQIKNSGQKNNTECKQKEQALIIEHARLRTTLNSMPTGVWIADINGRILESNEQAKIIWGGSLYQPDSMAEYGKYEGWWPDTGKKLKAEDWAMSRTLTKGEIIIGEEVNIRRFDGSFGTILNNAAPMRDNTGNIIGGVTVEQDITYQKKVEKALQESEAKYHGLFDSMAEAFELMELVYENGKPVDYIFLDVNPAWERMTGLQKEQVLGRKASEVVGSVERYWPEAMDRALRTGETVYIENYGVALDKWYSVNMWKFSETACGVTITDITERKRAEEELVAAHSQIQSIIDNTPDFIYAFDLEERFMLANMAVAKVLNSTPERMIGKRRHEFMPKMDADWHEANDRQVSEAGRVLEFEEYSHLENRSITWLTKKFPLRDAQGRIYAVAGISADITKRKQDEDMLLESELKYRTLSNTLEEKVKERTEELEEACNSLKESEINLAEAQEIAHIGNWIRDFATGEIHWSDEVYRIFGFKPQEFGINYESFLSRVHSEDRDYVTNKIRESLSKLFYDLEYRIVRADNEERVLHENVKVICDNENNPIQLKGTVQDITERKKAQEALAKIEIVRKQEIHHRIKNNLQVISSLLDLQAENFIGKKDIEESQILKAFKESQDRVISMALVHEELHKGGKVDTLNFSHYIKQLADKLILTYRLGNDNTSLDMDIEEDVFFDMDTAIPLGIIINELVSNSLKYAFCDRDKGEIQIKLKREKNGECESEDCNSVYVLMISDNGIGIPENIDIENLDSLGMQLVTSLVDQLDGELGLKRANGTEFTIKFTVK